MVKPNSYYQQYLEKYQEEVKKLRTKSFSLSMLRLLAFIISVVGIYLTFNIWQIATVIVILGIGVFLYLLSKYTDVRRNLDFYKAMVSLNEEELKIASGDFHLRDQGLKYQDPKHYYSLDIDLFGRGSFFQFMNRTVINEGTDTLAALLKSNNIQDIERRQKAINELRNKPEWRQYYLAKASLIAVETPTVQITSWLKNSKSFLPKVMTWLPIAFGLVSLIIIVLAILKVLNNLEVIGYWLFLGLGITGIYLKKINTLSQNTDKVRDTFRQYTELLDLIETETFKSELLLQKQKQIQSEEEKASVIFKKFVRALDALDNRNNLIGAIFGNGFFLTDLRNSYRVERWITKYAHKVEEWFKVISFFDAYNSLGNYVFNHPEFVFPEITKDNGVIEAKDLGHPLINSNKRITSDLNIDNEQFFIVTGANMAGKSTFLRTVSLHIVMANTGLPVCASSSKYRPMRLVTSMRTSDSLTDDSSYFFSELTRLKFIVDTIAKESYFIVLDEILKGTNSTDKAIGSKKFVEKLVASNATGIIATHDLSLCEIEKDLSDVKNYYFDAEIVNDELYFDYKLKKGVCKNMNASFLLKKMEIV